MYKIKRYAMLNDLELMLTEQLDRKMSEQVANEIYHALIELIVAALNDESTDTITGNPLSLIDRIDKQFRERSFFDYIRLVTFDYTVQLAETIRLHFITLGCPRYVKYALEFSKYHFQNATDLIKIDFELTSLTFLERVGYLQAEEIKEDVNEDNPSLELLNEHYDAEEQ